MTMTTETTALAESTVKASEAITAFLEDMTNALNVLGESLADAAELAEEAEERVAFVVGDRLIHELDPELDAVVIDVGHGSDGTPAAYLLRYDDGQSEAIMAYLVEDHYERKDLDVAPADGIPRPTSVTLNGVDLTKYVVAASITLPGSPEPHVIIAPDGEVETKRPAWTPRRIAFRGGDLVARRNGTGAVVWRVLWAEYKPGERFPRSYTVEGYEYTDRAPFAQRGLIPAARRTRVTHPAARMESEYRVVGWA